ncbi:formate/nitrite transporter family protein [Mycolicibacterium sp.]|jgi:formate/nitrite transporter FocA (FNT family)|uniref:formate/nitrite transporter family protein n=1 Tax=Mycolicibacterium sp. TaxID=2320850 RepID=UPI001A3579E8|nr:formate/nitrite transporter family protein [Mycolicibacterium sp.]MBJ7400019.1 formate/nitrite transporter family protein [Mycolicibacterium sp.]
MADAGGLPPSQDLSSEHVIDELSRYGIHRIRDTSVPQIIVLSVMGGGFITMGALFSVLLSEQVQTLGPRYLLQGFGFSAGFFFVILSGSILFTEANVVLPSTLLRQRPKLLLGRLVVFWALAFIGNFLGAIVTSWLISRAQVYPPEMQQTLEAFVAKKTYYHSVGTPTAWFQALLSGVLANWMVGMAAFFATMGRTIIGKYIPVLLAVSLFCAANFQHSVANMAYFGLISAEGKGPGWWVALNWNIIPVGIGNMIGGALLVALPFSYAFRAAHRGAAEGHLHRMV